jgi:hypothetical protein
MALNDVVEVSELLNATGAHYPIALDWSPQRVAERLLPRPGVIGTWVGRDQTGRLCDLVSTLFFERTAPNGEAFACAQGFIEGSTRHSTTALLAWALHAARAEGVAVMDSLDTFNRSASLRMLRFEASTAESFLYIYNWQVPALPPDAFGLTPW